MKKIVLITSGIIFILNTFCFIIYTRYNSSQFIFSSVGILTTALFLFFTSYWKIQNAYKIGLIFLFLITGIIKFIFSLLSSENFSNNIPLFLFISTICFEIIISTIVIYISHHASINTKE